MSESKSNLLPVEIAQIVFIGLIAFAGSCVGAGVADFSFSEGYVLVGIFYSFVSMVLLIGAFVVPYMLWRM